MRKRVGTFHGMAVVEDDELGPNEWRLENPQPFGPPAPPDPMLHLKTFPAGLLRYRKMTREEVEATYGIKVVD